ncbi:uncharacterized protein [Ptychodera flava]|uniref:uncharacterized protein n=1 Tax=Ptychodera flava TaxID=63121 RepID=UPI00396A219D
MTADVPLLSSIMKSALTTKKNADQIAIQEDGSYGTLTPAFGIIMSIILHLRSRRKFSMIQAFNSIQMYKSGCSQKLFQCFQHIGICLGVLGTRLTVDRLRKEYSHEISTMKNKIEMELRGNCETGATVERNLTSNNDVDVGSRDVASVASRDDDLMMMMMITMMMTMTMTTMMMMVMMMTMMMMMVMVTMVMMLMLMMMEKDMTKRELLVDKEDAHCLDLILVKVVLPH